MKREIIISGIVFVLLLVFFYSFVPCIKKENKGYNCRLCGATKSKRTTYFHSIPVWKTWTKNYENELTKIYNDNIGIEHEHQWTGGGYSSTNYTLLKKGVHSDGAHFVKPYPFFQRYLTYMALHAVEQLKSWPKEEKIELYHTIINCTNPEDFEQIKIIYENTKSPLKDSNQNNPNQIWTDWFIAQKSKSSLSPLSE